VFSPKVSWRDCEAIPDPYPDYTSGANSITGAFMRTLALYFGDHAFTFDVTSTVPAVVQKTRTYAPFLRCC
jgi:hypothetical protein